MHSIVTALRADHPARTPEVETIVVQTRDDGRCVLTLDDGTTLDVDTTELHAATADSRAMRHAA